MATSVSLHTIVEHEAHRWGFGAEQHMNPDMLDEYVQIYLDRGEDEANATFPQIGAHLVACHECCDNFVDLCENVNAMIARGER